MKKSYSETLRQWLEKEKSKKTRPLKHLVAFLAYKEDVYEALSLGYTMKDIWHHLKSTGKISCRYETFTKYVKRYIKERQDSVDSQQSEKPKITQEEPKTLIEQEKRSPRSISSVFKINHDLKKEDVI